MTRKVCLFISALQLAVLGILVSMSLAGAAGTGSRETDEMFFKVLGISFIALSPFGFLSLLMSAGFAILIRSPSFRPGLRGLVSSRSLGMRIVWKELLDDLNLEPQDE